MDHGNGTRTRTAEGMGWPQVRASYKGQASMEHIMTEGLEKLGLETTTRMEWEKWCWEIEGRLQSKTYACFFCYNFSTALLLKFPYISVRPGCIVGTGMHLQQREGRVQAGGGADSLLCCFVLLHWIKWIFQTGEFSNRNGPNSLSSLNRKCNGDLNLLPSMESVTFSSSILIGEREGEGGRTFSSTHCVASVIVMLVTMH